MAESSNAAIVSNEAYLRLEVVEHSITSTNANVTQMSTEMRALTAQSAQLATQMAAFIASQSQPRVLPTSPPPPPPLTNFVNLHLPLPPPYTGISSEFPIFRLKITQAIRGNLITEQVQQIDYASGALQGDAAVWFQGLLGPNGLISPLYTLDIFLDELERYFGGAITLQTREKALADLRQTGSVTELAIAFQNITNTFSPRWPDHPLIWAFSLKLKSDIKYELFSRGAIPVVFHDYVAAAVFIEQNLAAANRSRQGHPSPPPSRPASRPSLLPSPGQHTPGSDPMQVDGTRGTQGILTTAERQRRQAANTCHTCGQHGHHARQCGKDGRGGQSAYQLRGAVALPLVAPPGYPDAPPGYQLGYVPLGVPPVYPTPWAQLPPPLSSPSSFVPPPGPKNFTPSQ